MHIYMHKYMRIQNLFKTCPQHNSSRFETIKTWSQLEADSLSVGNLKIIEDELPSPRVWNHSHTQILCKQVLHMIHWSPCRGEFVIGRLSFRETPAPTAQWFWDSVGFRRIPWSQGQQSQSRFKTLGSLQGLGQIHGPPPAGACDQSLQQGICKPWWL